MLFWVARMRKLALAIFLLFAPYPAYANYLQGNTPITPVCVLYDNDGATDIDNISGVRLFQPDVAKGLINPLAFLADDSDPYMASPVKALQNFQSQSYPIYAYQG